MTEIITVVTHDVTGEPCDSPEDFEQEKASTCGHGFKAHEVYA